MEYRIVLTKNKKKRKVLYKCQTNETAINRFRSLIKENKVTFPQRFINYGKIIPVEFEIILIKERTPEDKNRIVRNRFGKLVEETINDGKWVIVDKAPYDIEETFWVYGYHHITERFDIKRILKEVLLKNIRKKYHTKQIVVAQNKLVFQSDEDLDVVICKNKSDAMRLHDTLFDACVTTRIDKLLFLGVSSDKMISDLYRKIEEKTGWDRKRVTRPTTRH